MRVRSAHRRSAQCPLVSASLELSRNRVTKSDDEPFAAGKRSGFRRLLQSQSWSPLSQWLAAEDSFETRPPPLFSDSIDQNANLFVDLSSGILPDLQQVRCSRHPGPLIRVWMTKIACAVWHNLVLSCSALVVAAAGDIDDGRTSDLEGHNIHCPPNNALRTGSPKYRHAQARFTPFFG